MAIRSARGTKDILPSETPHWRFLEDLARDLAEDYGYREIRTPVFESMDLFLQGMGATAGLVERELWTFHDKHGRKLALRADGTAPILRAFHEHGLGHPEDGPTKLWYLGPVFLHGREREVESRQGHQFGFEALGSLDAALDAEVVVMVADFCSAAGLSDVKVSLNSLGCKKCRPAYHQALKDYFGGRQDELCKTCKRRYKSHPLWTLGCPEDTCFDLSRVAPSIYGFLCGDCRGHFSALKTYLTELKVQYQLNPLVVRDLEYYDRTIFEVSCAGRPVGFGGRYDELSVAIGGPATPGVGCTVDMEPLLQAMHDVGLEVPSPELPRVCLAGQGEEAVALLLPILYALRRAGVRAELAYPTSAGETASEAARRSQAQLVVLLEEEDARRRIVTLTDTDRGRSQEVRLEEAISRIGRELGVEGLKDTLRPVEVRRLSITRRRRPIRGRSRAMYGTDVPGPSRSGGGGGGSRPAPADEGRDEEGGRRRRRRRSSRRDDEGGGVDNGDVRRRSSSRDDSDSRRRSSTRDDADSRRRTGEGEGRRQTSSRSGEGESRRQTSSRSGEGGRQTSTRGGEGEARRQTSPRNGEGEGRRHPVRGDEGEGRRRRSRGDSGSDRAPLRLDEDSAEREAPRDDDRAPESGVEREGRRRRRRSRRRGGSDRPEGVSESGAAPGRDDEGGERRPREDEGHERRPREDEGRERRPREDESRERSPREEASREDEGGERRPRRRRAAARDEGGEPRASESVPAPSPSAESSEPAREPEARPRRRRSTRSSEEPAVTEAAEAPRDEAVAEPRRRTAAPRRRRSSSGGEGEAVAAHSGGDEP